MSMLNHTKSVGSKEKSCAPCFSFATNDLYIHYDCDEVMTITMLMNFEDNKEIILDKYKDHPAVKNLIAEYHRLVTERNAKWERAHMMQVNNGSVNDKVSDDFFETTAKEIALYDEIMDIIDALKKKVNRND